MFSRWWRETFSFWNYFFPGTKRVCLSVYPGYLPWYYPYPTSFVSSVQYHTLPDKFCEFCNTFIPLPYSSSVSSSKTSVYARIELHKQMLVSPLLRREMVRTTSVNVSPRRAQSMEESMSKDPSLWTRQLCKFPEVSTLSHPGGEGTPYHQEKASEIQLYAASVSYTWKKVNFVFCLIKHHVLKLDD